MDKELMCYICTKLFTSPVLLPCGHSLCLTCAEKHYKYYTDNQTKQDYEWLRNSSEISKNYQVTCPVCSFEFTLPNGGVYGFVKNRIVENIIAKGSGGAVRGEFCCEFCDEEATVKASFMCKECEYWYCSECINSMHPLKGPLAYHAIIEPREKQKQGCAVGRCDFHDELMDLYCLQCTVSACESCLDDFHKNHTTESLHLYTKRVKDCIAAKLKLFIKSCNNVKEHEDEHEKLFLCVQLAAGEVEAHVKRQTEELVKIIERKKEEFLQEIEAKYLAASNEISIAAQECRAVFDEGMNFAELVSLLLEEGDSLLFAQTATPMLRRLDESLNCINTFPKPNWSALEKFNKMSIDATAQIKSISKLDWLDVPDSTSFVKERCYGRNCSFFIEWYPLHCQVDSYILEMKVRGDNDEFASVYEGRENSCILAGIKYGETFIIRIKAENRAGTGVVSDEMMFSMPNGFDLRFSAELGSLDMKLSADLKAVKSTKQTVLVAIGDSVLSNHIHYWCCSILDFPLNDQNAFFEIGIIKEEFRNVVRQGIATDSYTLKLLLPDSSTKSISSSVQKSKAMEGNHVTLFKSVGEMKDMVLGFVLDLNEFKFNIYANGQIVSQLQSMKDASFDILHGSFSPFIRTAGAGIHVKSVSNFPMPIAAPDPPRILHEKCYTKNTKATIAWRAMEQDSETYVSLLEVKVDGPNQSNADCQQFKEIYRGRRTVLEYETFEYKAKITARAKHVNVLGIGCPSEEVTLETPPGLIFNFVSEGSEMLHLKECGALIFDPGHTEACLLGDVDLSQGKHCWGFHIRTHGHSNICIGFGASACVIEFNMLSEHSQFRAVVLYNSMKSFQQNKAESTNFRRKRNFIVSKLWKSLDDLQIVLAVDFSSKTMNAYINGLLVKESEDKTHDGSTFTSLSCTMKPALWVKGGGIDVMPLTGLSYPGIPGPPIINRNISKLSNTCLYLEWKITEASDFVDFFIVEISSVHRKHASRNTGKFKEVFRGLKTNLQLKDLSYSRTVSCRVLAVNSNGKSKPCDVFEGLTIRGFVFQFDQKSAHPDLKIINARTVALSSPVYATIMGNVSISNGSHYWEVLVEQFESQKETAVIGIGIAMKELQDPILGEDVYSYGIQLHQHPKVVCTSTSNKILLKRSKLEAEKKIIGIHVNLDSNWMDIFFNGTLVARRKKSRRSFNIEHGTYYPAFSLYGTNTVISLRCEIDFDERFRNE